MNFFVLSQMNFPLRFVGVMSLSCGGTLVGRDPVACALWLIMVERGKRYEATCKQTKSPPNFRSRYSQFVNRVQSVCDGLPEGTVLEDVHCLLPPSFVSRSALERCLLRAKNTAPNKSANCGNLWLLAWFVCYYVGHDCV